MRKRRLFDKSAKPGTPCRGSLTDDVIGEIVIILDYAHQPKENPYQATHPIFVREGAKHATIAMNEVPEVVRSRLISMCMFNKKHMMVDADALTDGTVSEMISKAFENIDIA